MLGVSGASIAEQNPFYEILKFAKEWKDEVDAENKAAEDRYTDVLRTWHGSDINELIASWGAPSGQYKMPNGNFVYSWVKSKSTKKPDYVEPDGFGGGYIVEGKTNTYTCKTEVFTDTDGKIVNLKWKGNSCGIYK